MRTCLLLSLGITFGFVSSPLHAATTIIDDHFADGNLGTNPDTGNGFTSNSLSGPDWVEAGTDASHTLGGTASNRASLQSNDSFVANGAQPLRATFTVSDWSRSGATTSGNGRFVVGIAPSGTAADNPFAPNKDGLWIGMNSDGDSHAGFGVGGITYIDGGAQTAFGSGWNWDDNGNDTPGATLIDIVSTGANREDRTGITFNAPDLIMTVELGADSWSISFASSGGGVTLPANQSGTFSGLGATNDLSNAIVSIYHQGNANHFASLDRIVVETIPEPSATALFGLGGLVLLLRRVRR